MFYHPKVIKSPHSFSEILKEAKTDFLKLSTHRQKELKESLAHGQAKLNSKDELNAYLSAYGEIHQEKLILAYNRIPQKVWAEDGISVVDYGCGQGIAEMVLSDFLESKYKDNDFVKDVTLIEPSSTNLSQSIENVSSFFPESKVFKVLKTDSQLSEIDVRPFKSTVLHILSNVIDLEDFDGNIVTDLLSGDVDHNNIVVCVSPYYQEESRGKRMEEFGEKLRGYTLASKLEKHIDDWDQPFSCQLHIYVSSYY